MNEELLAESVESTHVTRTAEPPSLTALLGQLSGDLKLLAQQEARLAKHELTETVKGLKAQLAALAVGGVALLLGVLTLVAAAVLGLATVLPAWASALIIGGSFSGIGIALLLGGKAKLARVNLAPERTLESVQKDVDAIKRAAT